MLTVYDEFSGVGGTSRGASFVPGVRVAAAANHDEHACREHARNFPDATHYQADVTKLDMTKMPRADIFTASPACPAWTDANGVRRDFDKANAVQHTLPGLDANDDEDPKLAARREEYRRSRLLMEEVPRYLRAMDERGEPVLVGMVENVIQCRLWAEWDRWIGEIRKIGYQVRVIAFNSMHARPVRAPWAPQSRDRLFVAYWHNSLNRSPDWDKWLRPQAWCPTCGEWVNAMQVFKNPRNDMGRYRAQYTYVCPKVSCRHGQVYPEVVPALAAIDPTKPGVRIGDRVKLGLKDLAPATMGRIRAGMVKHWAPLLTPSDGMPQGSVSTSAAAPAVRGSDGVALPPLLVPVEGRPDKQAAPATEPMRTQTTRSETGLALPFITPLRGGGDKNRSRAITEPAGTVTASGNHHGLAIPPMSFLMRNNTPRSNAAQMCTPVTEPARTVTTAGHQSLVTWASQLLVPYYGAADSAQPAAEPVGALTTRERYGLATAHSLDVSELPDVDDVLFRMLEDDEIGRLMGFDSLFRNEAPSKRIRVRLYGNAVCPPVAELIVSALVEAVTGESLERAA
ncbi:DNA cytosine methyltransferase [Micromonospora haikouensis]|uniref:DNA cytosine methyltransferase n=1 Tax=Micromonospora haikouensis TaxID=686309 RepID=UPI00341D00E2